MGSDLCSEFNTGLRPMEEILLEIEAGEVPGMPTTKERFEGIEARFKIIEGHLGICPKISKSRFRPETLAEWSEVVGVALALVVATCTATWYLGGLMLGNRINAALGPIQNKVNAINGDIREIKGELESLRSNLDTVSLRQLSANPTDPDSAKSAERILMKAKASGTNLPSETISSVAKKFIAASQKSPDAWSAALAFFRYRSFLNASGASPLSNLTPYQHTHYNYFIEPVGPPPALSHWGSVPIARAARLNKIGTNLNANLPQGDEFLLLDGGTVVVDNMDIKNVVFRNATIVYNGNPLIMESVYFIDCTFLIKRSARSYALSAHLIEPPPINYSAPNT